MGIKDFPKKPLARDLCAIVARKRAKEAKTQGKKPLCESCLVKCFVVCPENGHACCDKRVETGWVPTPYGPEDCGLFTDKKAA